MYPVILQVKVEPLLQGTKLVTVEARDEDNALLASAYVLLDPVLGSILGSPIVDKARHAPREVIEQLRRKAEEEVERWVA